MSAFGLYFGNTNLCLAICKDGKTEVVANDSGDRVTPAVVAFSNGEKSVGLAAKNEMVRNFSNTICDVKKIISCCSSETEQLQSNCKLDTEDGIKYIIENNGTQHQYRPFQILQFLFEKMFEIAQSQMEGTESYPTVVTVPPEFSEEQRILVRDAAFKAGFQVQRIINEPTAAVLAYSLGSKLAISSPVFYLVYRLGGTSLDVSIIVINGGAYQLVSNKRHFSLGGKNFTSVLADHCAQEYKRQIKFDIRESKRSYLKLTNAVEACKHVLSSMESSQCFAESLYDGMDMSINVSRARFESLLTPLLSQCLEPVKEVLQEAGITKDQIQKVVVCGGSCKIQKIQNMLSSYFPSAELLNSRSPDEVIAHGAALQAFLLLNRDISDCILGSPTIPCLSRGICLKSGKGDHEVFIPAIPRKTPIPARWQHSFTTGADQNSLCLEVYEESEDCTDCTGAVLLGKVVMKDLLENTTVVSAISVKSDGSVHVSCTDKENNRTETLCINGNLQS